MTTGGYIIDEQAMTLGRCPHCARTVKFQPVLGKDGSEAGVVVNLHDPLVEDNPVFLQEPPRWRRFRVLQCPSCWDVIVWMFTWNTCEADRELRRIYPLRSNHPPVPAGTPAHIARAYEEAAHVLQVSPNAAAALARRALQLILREVSGVRQANLKAEIEATRGTLPPWIIEALDNVRKVGNFALHPEKDEMTGTVVETEPGEAELTVSLVEALLQHLFAGRDAASRLAQALASKKAAGGGSQT